MLVMQPVLQTVFVKEQFREAFASREVEQINEFSRPFYDFSKII